jgi:hypothetical protein
MAGDGRHDLDVRVNHQLQMAEPPSSTWRLSPDPAIRPACFDRTATCFWEPPSMAGGHNGSVKRSFNGRFGSPAAAVAAGRRTYRGTGRQRSIGRENPSQYPAPGQGKCAGDRVAPDLGGTASHGQIGPSCLSDAPIIQGVSCPRGQDARARAGARAIGGAIGGRTWVAAAAARGRCGRGWPVPSRIGSSDDRPGR